MVMIPAGLGHENDCAGKYRACYIKTITATMNMEKKLLDVSLRALVTKTN
jgi:hypothetical protein